MGCGADRYGDVRLDVSKHFLNYDMCPNILGDAQYLPFKDNSFTIVKCQDVLEHLPNPFLAMKECTRVSKNLVVLRVPTERDIWPAILLNLLPLPKLNLYYMLKSRKQHMHLWIIQHKIIVKFLCGLGFEVRVFAQSSRLLPLLEYGRNMWFLRRVSGRLRIRMEYFVVAKRNNEFLKNKVDCEKK